LYTGDNRGSIENVYKALQQKCWLCRDKHSKEIEIAHAYFGNRIKMYKKYAK
jgi:hypothetical protein